MRKRFAFITLLFFSTCCCSQSIPYTYYSVKDGLPHSNVYRIVQDSLGYLWLGTDYGLAQFDGAHFQTFTTQDGLSGNYITALHISKTGDLWSGAYREGMHRMHDHEFTAIPGLQSPLFLIDIQEDPTGKLWLLEKKGVRTYQAGTETRFRKVEESRVGELLDFWVPADAPPILLADSGMFRLEGDSARRTFLAGFEQERLYCIEADEQGRYYLGGEGAIFLPQPTGWTRVPLPKGSQHPVSHLLTCQDGSLLLFVKGEGLFQYHQGRFNALTVPLELENVYINDLFQDQHGNVWIATYGKGLLFLPYTAVTAFRVEEGLPNNFVSALCSAPDGKVWVGTFSGLVTIQEDRIQEEEPPLPRPTVTRWLQADDTGGCWGYRFGEFFHKEDGKPPEMIAFDLAAVQLQNDHRYQVKVENGRSWVEIVGPAGIQRLGEVPNLMIRCIHGDQAGRVWVGTLEGAYCYTDTGYFSLSTSNGLPGNQVLDICQGQDGWLWMGTESGLVAWKDGALKVFAPGSGLCHPRVSSLELDAEGNLWIGTLGGVNYLPGGIPGQLQQVPAFLGQEINTICLDPAKNVWVGTNDGVLRIPAAEALRSSPRPSLFFTHIEIGTNPLPFDSVAQLPAGHLPLRLTFQGLDPAFRSPVHYRYRWQHGDTTWQTTREHELVFSSLTPGAYTLEIEALNAEMTPSQPLYFSFEIFPPFWQRAWFLGVVGLILCSLLLLGFQWRIKVVKARQHRTTLLELKIIELRQQALGAAMDPHFLVNSLLNLRFLMQQESSQATDLYLEDLARFIRKSLENSRRNLVPLDTEFDLLRTYLELQNQRFPDRFDYELLLSDDIDPEEAEVPPMVLQTLVENALRHGILPGKRKGSIRVTALPLNGGVQLTVEDNGVGLPHPPSSDPHPHGLSMTQERLALLRTLTDQPWSLQLIDRKTAGESTTGVRVLLHIPIEA